MPKITLFELKEKMATLGAAIAADAEWIAEKAANPETPMEEINAKKQHRDELAARLDMLKAEHDAMEAEQRERVQAISEGGERNDQIRAKAAFYRAALGKDKAELRKAYAGLGALPAGDADLGTGEKLLPKNVADELIVEPFADNPMRGIVRVSQIPGLEEPKLAFDIDGSYDNITDKETAKEIKMSSDTVSYGRNKVKVRAQVSDTVLLGTDTNLVTEIENALRSGLAVNEMNRMFAASPTGAYTGMSFYSAANNVTAVTGATKQAAIAAALASLPLMFRRNAKIVMSGEDWFNMWGANLNQAGTYFENRPLQLFGKPVVLVDDAAEPVVGDFSFSRINYDIGTTYDTDKDIDTGMYKFVLTAWYDIKLRLKSAFRIARVQAGG